VKREVDVEFCTTHPGTLEPEKVEEAREDSFRDLAPLMSDF
jgi:hypothetical protein